MRGCAESSSVCQRMSPEWYGKEMWVGPGERSPVDERVNQAARASTGPASIPRRPWAMRAPSGVAMPLPQVRVAIQSLPSVSVYDAWTVERYSPATSNGKASATPK